MINKLVKLARNLFKKKSERTDNYDRVGSEVRNLLKATGATFIPKLCYALKEDWYPDKSEKEIQDNEDAREEIRSKIINEWSTESAGDEMGVWKEYSIVLWFPSWVKDPRYNGSPGGKASVEAKIAKKYMQKLEEQKIATKLEKLAEITPPAPKARETIEDTGPTTDVAGHMLTPIGEKGTIPLLSMGEINSAQHRLWEALTGREDWPAHTDDLQNDIVKPTREYRAALFQELMPHEQNGIAFRSGLLIGLLEDTIRSIEKLSK